ncbi:MAG TPA: DNA replication and repair protein RecF [Candidatus Limnocylindria bacterium]|nr:DNA replication and repair protein RecF [Candidatus Limnocylindria bacterium]
MRIKNIEIKNFRNYPSLNIQISSDTVVLTGPNAVGKTNLLESVYFASLFKSFRDDTEFIFLKDANNLELKLILERGGEDHELQIFLEKRDKVYANFVIDGVKKKRRDAQGYMSVVIFDPTDVDMFTKPPESRRKYLNMVLAQKNPDYLEAITNYKKVLFQKNRLLQDLKAGRTTAGDLASWNEQLVTLGSFIILERKQFVSFLNTSIAEIYATISGFHRPVEVAYETLEGNTLEEIAESFNLKLQAVEKKELMLATCLVGPHRDDFSLKSDGLYLSPFSSRGELRSQVLALKILELEYLSKADEKPILLLDDVLSELDETRRTFLLKYLQGKFQTFITTTHPLEMPAQHITLTPASVEEEQEEVES